MKQDYIALEHLLDYQFKDHRLLSLALTHRSYSSRNNERMEFLGDSVLNFVIADMIYQTFPMFDEGEMSRTRAQMVKESTLSELAHRLNLGDYLILGEGELKSAGWRRPSVLADAVEAIFAAIFLESGYPAVSQVIRKLFTPHLATVNPQATNKDAKTLLQEYLQAKKLALPHYQILRTEGEAHQQTFFVECWIEKFDIRTLGQGTSRRAAEQMAADLAFQRLPKDRS